MRLLVVLLEGQLYLGGILAVFLLEIAVLFWGLWSRRPIIGLVAVLVAVPLLRSTFSAIRACVFRIPVPHHGPGLDREDGRALYELVEHVRRDVGAPAVDRIAVTGVVTAGATAYARPWRVGRHRVLVLGFPVLATLSTPELRAVVAHELAHFSSAHDAFAAWVFRIRRRWFALRSSLDQRLATPVYVYWLLHWYVPRLNRASAEVARHHEFAADQVAASVAGAREAADALIAFEAGARFANDTYWPAIWESYTASEDVPQPYAGMLTWPARGRSADVLNNLSVETSPEDTHPSLRERIERLNEHARVPPPAARSAGRDILGPVFDTLAKRLDEEWRDTHGAAWRERRAAYVARRDELAALSALDTPTPVDVFRRAELVEALDGSDQALPLYEAASRLGHRRANVAAGRLRLDRGDATGVALIEDAMDRDDELVPEGCRILADYYHETQQPLAARKCEWRASRHATRVHLARS
jgi:Zn-dependent protease with chaperone function